MITSDSKIPSNNTTHPCPENECPSYNRYNFINPGLTVILRALITRMLIFTAAVIPFPSV